MFNQSKKSAITPFCKFCEGAGESKTVYTSHWQFSQPKDGVLTCRKLLNYLCKNCHVRGHIEKRCPCPKKKKEEAQVQPQVQENVKKFCRFCFNANKDDFNSHNQFDKDGFVICPILLEIECQDCGQKGHTKRYCNASTVNTTPKKADVEPYVVPRAPKKPMNQFAGLFVEEADEADDVLQLGNLTLFPELSETQVSSKTIMGVWAAPVTGNPTNRPPPPTRPPPQPFTFFKEPYSEIEGELKHLLTPKNSSWADCEW